MKKIKVLYEKYKQAVDYLFFGVLTTVVNWGVYGVLVKFAHVDYNVSNVIAWVMAVIFAFVTNKLWVFKSKSWDTLLVVKEAGAFLGARTATGLFEIGMLPVAVSLGLNQSLFGVENFIAKMLISFIVVLLNYILSKFFIFNNKR